MALILLHVYSCESSEWMLIRAGALKGYFLQENLPRFLNGFPQSSNRIIITHILKTDPVHL